MKSKPSPTIKHFGKSNLVKKVLLIRLGKNPTLEINIPLIDGVPGAGKTRYAINELVIKELDKYKPIIYLAETHRLVEEIKEKYFDNTPLQMFHKKGFLKTCSAYKIIKEKTRKHEFISLEATAFLKYAELGYPPKRLCKICRHYNFKDLLPYDKCMVRSSKIKESKSKVIGSVRHFLETKELKKKIKTKEGYITINRFNRVIADDLSWLDVSFRSYRKKALKNWFFLKSMARNYHRLPNSKYTTNLFEETDETFNDWCGAILEFQQKAFTHKFNTGSLIEGIYDDLTDFNLLMTFNPQKYAYWLKFNAIYGSSKQYYDYPMVFHLFDLAKEGVDVVLVGSQDSLLKNQLYQLCHRYMLETGVKINIDNTKYKIPIKKKTKQPDYVKLFRVISRGHLRMYWKVSLIEPTKKTASYPERVKKVENIRKFIKNTIANFLDYVSTDLRIPINHIEVGLVVYPELDVKGKKWLVKTFFPKNYPAKNLRTLHYNNLFGSNKFVEPYPVHVQIQLGSYVKNPEAALEDFKGIYPQFDVPNNIEAKKYNKSDEYSYQIAEIDDYIAYVNLYERKQAILRSRGQMPVLVFGDIPPSLSTILDIQPIEHTRINPITLYTFYGLQKWEQLLLDELKNQKIKEIRIHSSISTIKSAYSLLKEIDPFCVSNPRTFYRMCEKSTVFTIEKVKTKQSKQMVKVLSPKKNL
ncbi:MAG: hypothetical protein ACFE8J_08720 [Candidatus Heimdallarchaeota archaeon]